MIAVADEEIRGPLLLAGRSSATRSCAPNQSAEPLRLIDRASNALRGDDDGLGLPADERLLRAFDMAAMAMLRDVREQPIALLIDDVQWADQDSIRLLRYVVRANSTAPMYLMLTIRPEEMAQVTELVNLLADLERLGILRRMRVERLRQAETAAMLSSILGGEATPGRGHDDPRPG